MTAREREVLRLLGERLTNSEIADRLFISVRTVESHVSSLLTKLGAENRRDLAGFSAAASLLGFPLPQTPLIGREAELERIDDLLDRFRLVTLTGIGGSGKTRLAIEAGSRLASRFATGAAFVDLAPVVSADLVPVVVADRLGVDLGGSDTELENRSVDLVDRLIDWESLIVLDNCEGLLAATAELAALMITKCPDLYLLVTSREAFGIPGEGIYPVPPLEIPTGVHDAAGAESVLLLAERAEAVRPGLDIIATHLSTAVEICRQLEGLPLAIELAAVQLMHLTPEELADRLVGMDTMLEARHGIDPRQSTLKATMDWSYELLSDPERVLFNRLCVFVGWVDAHSIAAVCMSPPIEEDDVTELIASLVWKSLLLAGSEGPKSVYRTLETVRSYGLKRLEESGEADEVRSAHLEWCIGLAAEAAEHLQKAESSAWLDRLDTNLPNLRVGLEHALGLDDADVGSPLISSLWRFWHMRGDIAEGRRWADAFVESIDQPTMARARALEAAGGLAYWGGDMTSAQRHYEEGLGIVREHGSAADLANALYNTAFAYGFGGRTEMALPYLDQALEIFRGLGDRDGMAKCLWGWGACAQVANMQQAARPRLEEALDVLAVSENTFQVGWANWVMANVLFKLDEADASRPH
ncbi:MAG: ATP-binding protein, partial [Acidimicrobiia bacterium]